MKKAIFARRTGQRSRVRLYCDHSIGRDILLNYGQLAEFWQRLKFSLKKTVNSKHNIPPALINRAIQAILARTAQQRLLRRSGASSCFLTSRPLTAPAVAVYSVCNYTPLTNSAFLRVLVVLGIIGHREKHQREFLQKYYICYNFLKSAQNPYGILKICGSVFYRYFVTLGGIKKFCNKILNKKFSIFSQKLKGTGVFFNFAIIF